MLCAFFLKIMSEPTGRMTRLLTCQIEHTPQNVQGYHSAPRGGKKTPGGRVSFLFMPVPSVKFGNMKGFRLHTTLTGFCVLCVFF